MPYFLTNFRLLAPKYFCATRTTSAFFTCLSASSWSSFCCHVRPCEKASTIMSARPLMVSISFSASWMLCRFSSSNCSSLKSPCISRSTWARHSASAFFSLPKGILGMTKRASIPASQSAKCSRPASITTWLLTSESSMPVFPFDSNCRARCMALASGSNAVGPLYTSPSAPMMGMGSFISTCSPLVMGGMGDSERSGTGPVCTCPKVCSSRAKSALSGVMSPQRMSPMLEAT